MCLVQSGLWRHFFRQCRQADLQNKELGSQKKMACTEVRSVLAPSKILRLSSDDPVTNEIEKLLDIRRQCVSGLTTDVVLVCGDGCRLHAHAAILALASPMLASLLTRASCCVCRARVPVDHGPFTIFLEGVHSDAVDSLLDIFYTGSVQIINEDEISSKVAEKMCSLCGGNTYFFFRHIYGNGASRRFHFVPRLRAPSNAR